MNLVDRKEAGPSFSRIDLEEISGASDRLEAIRTSVEVEDEPAAFESQKNPAARLAQPPTTIRRSRIANVIRRSIRRTNLPLAMPYNGHTAQLRDPLKMFRRR
jgi:hypothetical protein